MSPRIFMHNFHVLHAHDTGVDHGFMVSFHGGVVIVHCTGTNSCESTHSYFRSMVGAVPRSIDTLETVLALTRLGYNYTRASRPMLGKRLDGDTLLAGIAATTARLLDSALHDASLARKFDCWRPKVRECNFRVVPLVWPPWTLLHHVLSRWGDSP